MPANTSTLDALLKDKYGPALRNELNDATPLLDMFQDAGKDINWQGRQCVEAVLVNRNRGSYFTAEGGQPPTAGNQQVENYQIPMRYQHGQIRITTQLMKSSRSNEGAFARGMRLEMDRLLDDMRIQRNFAMWGTGAGIRCLLSDDPGTGTDVDVDSPMNVAGTVNGARFINVGDFVGFINPLTGTLRAGGTREVTAIAADGSDFTVAAAVDTALGDNDWVVKAYGTDASLAIANTDYNHLPMGLLGMVDDGSYVNIYFGLSRSTFQILQSTVISSVGALSADVIQRGIDVAAQLGRGMPKYHCMHPSIRRAYLRVTEGDRRYTMGNLMDPDAGTKAAKDGQGGVGFGDVKLKVDHMAPYGMWFGVDPRSAYRYALVDGEWADETGAVLKDVSGAVDTFDGTYRIYENFSLLSPNQSFRLEDISATVVSIHIN